MSIVICTVFKNEKMFIASDKRAIRNGIKNEDYKKIYQVNPSIFFWMTGVAEEGHKILNYINSFDNQDTQFLIDKVDDFFHPTDLTLTISLGGKDKNNNYFVWQKNNSGKIINQYINPNELHYFISSNDDRNIFSAYFEKRLILGINLAQSIRDTIIYASTIDASVNDVIDFYEI